jgi:proteasome lid subunit RPN8/RPN11
MRGANHPRDAAVSPKPDPRPQAMPLERAILWNPSIPGAKQPEGTSRAPYPIFFQQEAVVALQEHVKSSPTQAIFGFLVGDLYRDPENGVLYSVIDKTLKLSQTIYGDKTELVVARLWDRMQEQLAKAAGTLLGWYHSHPGQGGLLTAHDIETHQKFFTDPWHVTILVAAEAGGVTGKFFRMSQNDEWHKTPLAFYELLQPDSIKPDGKKRSFIMWRNYKAFGPSLKGPKPKPPEPPPSPPKAAEEEAEEVAPTPPPPPPQSKGEKGFRIMRSSADDIPVIKTSADDEPAPVPKPEPPPPPLKKPPAPKPPPPKPPPPPAPPPPAPPSPPSPPPIAKSGDLPWAVTPESVASIPPGLAAPPPPTPRRTPAHTFRLLEEDAEKKPVSKPRRRTRRRAGPWLKRFAIILLLAGAGAGGYWYLAIRNPGVLPGLLNRAKQLVSRVTTRKPSPPPPASPRRRTTAVAPPAPPPAAALPPAASSPPRRPATVPAPVPVPQPTAPPSPFARFDRLTDSLRRAVGNFQDRAALFASGRMDCGGLATGLVSIENLWTSYNAERRARMASFDPPRATRDQAMYAAVDSVESRFEHSGCPRP